MSIQSCQVTPSSQRSHLAVMRSGLTRSVDRTAPLASAGGGRATAATSPPPVKVHTVLVNPGIQDRNVALVVIGAACERISSRVVFDELDRLDSLIPDHDVDVWDKEEA